MTDEQASQPDTSEDQASPDSKVPTMQETPLEAWQKLSWFRRTRAPLLLFMIGLVVFSLFTWDRLGAPSPDNHFVHLADSYLSGTLEMQEAPPHGNDWASYETRTLASGEVLEGIWWNRGERKFLDLDGNLYVIDRADMIRSTAETHYFVSFPPMPAVLMIPGVMIWGTDFNDIWFTIFFAALNLALVYWLLRWLALTGRTSRSPSDNVWLSLLMAFGSAHLWCSVMGAVWFTALVVGVTFAILYIRFAIDAEHPFLAGLFLAMGFATRTPILFTVVFFAWFHFFPEGKLRRRFDRTFVKNTLLFGLAPMVVGALLMAANVARFHHATEFGHTYLAGGQIDRIKTFGLFNIHFLTKNLAALLVLLPKFQPDAPYVIISRHGLALWFTSPALLYLLWPRPAATDKDRHYRRAAWSAVLAVMVLHLLYQNTGWAQFGYRFAMDYMAYLTVLLALGSRPITWRFKTLITVGFLINAFGAVTFNRFGQYYAEFFIEA